MYVVVVACTRDFIGVLGFWLTTQKNGNANFIEDIQSEKKNFFAN
jgi:hypothetical protein